MPAMKNATQDIAATVTMLERAREVLELTYHDWRLHERPQRRRKAARKQEQKGILARYGRGQACSAPLGNSRAYA